MNTLKLLCTCRLLRIFTGSKFDPAHPISGVYDGHAVISSSVVLQCPLFSGHYHSG